MLIAPCAPGQPVLKECRVCHERKPPDAFAGRRRSPDGLQAHCRLCGRQMLDAADAKRRAARRAARRGQLLILDRADLVRVLTTQVETVVDWLVDCAQAGAADTLDRLHTALCNPCPDDDPEANPAADGCLLALIGNKHTNELAERAPGAIVAMAPAWQAVFPPIALGGPPTPPEGT